MSTNEPFAEVLAVLEPQRQVLATLITADARERMELYRTLSLAAATQALDAAVLIMFDALRQNDPHVLIEWTKQRFKARFDQGLQFDEALQFPAIFRRHTTTAMLPAITGHVPGASEGLVLLNTAFDGVVDVVGQLYKGQIERANAEREQMQDEMIRMQELALRELSTPLLAVSDHAVVMPLIGAIDSRRAQQVIETLLEGITTHGATIAILDITGVTVVDTQVANALLRAAQAVRLLGARVVLTGIRPEIAQTLVGLGADLSEVVTRSSLQSGIAYAIGQR
jgi:anti-anti-sigma regulatory factor